MSRIIGIENENVSIGMDDGTIFETLLSSFNYEAPGIGDEVDVYISGDKVIVVKSPYIRQTPRNESVIPMISNERTVNKHIFVWVANFIFGCFGVDRFMRGQTGLGILKLVTCGCFGVWALADFLIAAVKAYAVFTSTDYIVFINGKYAA